MSVTESKNLAIPNYTNFTIFRTGVWNDDLLAELLRKVMHIGKDRSIRDENLQRVRIYYEGDASMAAIRATLKEHATRIVIRPQNENCTLMIWASFCTTRQNMDGIIEYLMGSRPTTDLPALPPARNRRPGMRTYISGQQQNRKGYPYIALATPIGLDTGVPLPSGYYGQPYQPNDKMPEWNEQPEVLSQKKDPPTLYVVT